MNPQPNIILILADDMGYGDVACYDPEYNRVPTPNIDRLAEHPEKVAELTAVLEQAVYGGRTTPGAPCANDVQVDIWKKETRS